MLSYGHISLDQDLDYLVNDYQYDSENEQPPALGYFHNLISWTSSPWPRRSGWRAVRDGASP